VEALQVSPIAEQRYGDFGIRFAARLVDEVILATLGFVIGMIGEAIGTSTAQWLAIGISFLFGVFYQVGFWAISGQTPGKLACRLRVVRPDSDVIGIGGRTAFLRYLGYYASAAVLCAGFIAIAMDPKRQGWHDKIANTYAIRESASANGR
jgi:uncharacterized RDD family membrane protein YckC